MSIKTKKKVQVDIQNSKAYKEYESWQKKEFKGGYDDGELAVHDWLWGCYKDCYDGIIVDVGANDGVTQSHSLPFIEKGWRAVLIEPHPKMFEVIENIYKDIESVQTANYAVYNGNKTVLNLYSGHTEHLGHSTLVSPENQGKVRIERMDNSQVHLVNANSLTNILKECGLNEKIDILHIDAEDFGLEVLKSLDFDIYEPAIISVDIHHNPEIGDPLAKPLLEFMKDKGYEHIVTYAQSLWKKND